MKNTLCRMKAEFFQALAHPTRIAIVELLIHDTEFPVNVICERLGLEQANISQHLAVLRSKEIVGRRKDGNKVFYSLRDPMLGRIFDLIRRYFKKHLEQTLKLLGSADVDQTLKTQQK